MNAAELLAITIANQKPTEDILAQCQECAKHGLSEMILYSHLATEQVSELANFGLAVRRGKGPSGETLYLISWA